ncbi:MAG: type II secretion system F family protein [Acidimicrobiia bacterium]
MTAPLLALAWGVLLALPIAVAARRAAARARARELVPAKAQPAGRSVPPLVPAPLRHVTGRVVARRRARRRAQEIGRELPLVLDLLQVAVTAGCTPYRALELTARWGPAACSAAFGAALDATRVGSSLRDALDSLALDAPTLTPVTDVLLSSDRLGAPAGPALTRLAHDVRADLRRRAEARARTLPVKLLFPLVFLVLPAFGLLTVVPALLSAVART